MSINKKFLFTLFLDVVVVATCVIIGMNLLGWGVNIYEKEPVSASIFMVGGGIIGVLSLILLNIKMLDNRLRFGAGYKLSLKNEEEED